MHVQHVGSQKRVHVVPARADIACLCLHCRRIVMPSKRTWNNTLSHVNKVDGRFPDIRCAASSCYCQSKAGLSNVSRTAKTGG